MTFRHSGAVKFLALLQALIVQLDTIFCSVEFNGNTNFNLAPWDFFWSAAQLGVYVVLTTSMKI
jgi:hypothetical protein